LYLSENVQFVLERPADSGVGDIVGVYYENLNKTGSALYRNIEARSRNHFSRAKAVSITYCVRLYSCLHSSSFLRSIVLLPVACLAPPYFYKLSHKRRDFRKSFTEYKLPILIFSATLV